MAYVAFAVHLGPYLGNHGCPKQELLRVPKKRERPGLCS
jgi:hypothetical protein